eukprot:GHVP01067158.1.p1 GENE.GHVP01067158.1~~GHVP01067158.1.p1  ORF type:complete len:777 (+),score=112.47 GHVP01067158.1:2830-5160(+)
MRKTLMCFDPSINSLKKSHFIGPTPLNVSHTSRPRAANGMRRTNIPSDLSRSDEKHRKRDQTRPSKDRADKPDKTDKSDRSGRRNSQNKPGQPLRVEKTTTRPSKQRSFSPTKRFELEGKFHSRNRTSSFDPFVSRDLVSKRRVSRGTDSLIPLDSLHAEIPLTVNHHSRLSQDYQPMKYVPKQDSSFNQHSYSNKIPSLPPPHSAYATNPTFSPVLQPKFLPRRSPYFMVDHRRENSPVLSHESPSSFFRTLTPVMSQVEAKYQVNRTVHMPSTSDQIGVIQRKSSNSPPSVVPSLISPTNRSTFILSPDVSVSQFKYSAESTAIQTTMDTSSSLRGTLLPPDTLKSLSNLDNKFDDPSETGTIPPSIEEDQSESPVSVKPFVIENGLGETYRSLEPIGQGSFGVVFSGVKVETGETVAIKKVRRDKRFKNRELQLLQKLNHSNIVKFITAMVKSAPRNHPKMNFQTYNFIVTEKMPTCVYNLMKKAPEEKLSPRCVKLIAYQACRVLGYLHVNGICHRDIKPQNFLIDPKTHLLKLCDFGSAKVLDSSSKNVSYICSRYYRAPELIAGSNKYTTAVDMWSFGCVLAEMLNGYPLFRGLSSVDHLIEIVRILGNPSAEDLDEMCQNRSVQFPYVPPQKWSSVLSKRCGILAVDFCSRFLTYRPSQRLHPLAALAHPYFEEIRVEGSMPIEEIEILDLFGFQTSEFEVCSRSLREILLPQWARKNAKFLKNLCPVWNACGEDLEGSVKKIWFGSLENTPVCPGGEVNPPDLSFLVE